MSLIQEALKRQQQEYGNKAGPEAPPSPTGSEPPVTETMPVMPKPALEPPAPAAMPLPAMPPLPPRPAPSSKPWLMIGGMGAAALIVLMVGGLIVAKWTLKMAQKKAIPTLAAQPVMPSPGSVMPIPKTEPDKTKGAESAVLQPVSKRESPSTPAALPSSPSSQGSLPPTPLVTASKEPASPVPQVLETAGRTDIPPAEKPSMEKTPPVPLQWPVLKLTGILSSPTPGEGAARINNQMIFVGGEIEGATLVEIRSEGVLLRYGDETRFLKMGGVMY